MQEKIDKLTDGLVKSERLNEKLRWELKKTSDEYEALHDSSKACVTENKKLKAVLRQLAKKEQAAMEAHYKEYRENVEAELAETRATDKAAKDAFVKFKFIKKEK